MFQICSREVQAFEGKKLAESWGATFMEASARENQVLSVKARLGGMASSVLLTRCLVVGMVSERCVCRRSG